jgi:hypothetical protein
VDFDDWKRQSKSFDAMSRAGRRARGRGTVYRLALALAAGKVIQGLLFNVAARDAFVLALVTAVVGVATLAA